MTDIEGVMARVDDLIDAVEAFVDTARPGRDLDAFVEAHNSILTAIANLRRVEHSSNDYAAREFN